MYDSSTWRRWRFAPNHHEHLGVGTLRSCSPYCQREGRRFDERVAPCPDVCDVSVAKLAVTKRFADRGQEAPLLYGYARPDVIDELLFRDDLTRAIGKIEQNIQRPTADGTH